MKIILLQQFYGHHTSICWLASDALQNNLSVFTLVCGYLKHLWRTKVLQIVKYRVKFIYGIKEYKNFISRLVNSTEKNIVSNEMVNSNNCTFASLSSLQQLWYKEYLLTTKYKLISLRNQSETLASSFYIMMTGGRKPCLSLCTVHNYSNLYMLLSTGFLLIYRSVFSSSPSLHSRLLQFDWFLHAKKTN